MHKNIFQFLIFLIPFLIFSQSEYKYDQNKELLPNWVKEMYKDKSKSK